MLLMCVPAAHADPLVVTGGGYDPDFEGHRYRVVGSGFDLSQNELLFYPQWTLDICRPCGPGDIVDLSSVFDGSSYFGSGRGTIDGVSYPALTYRGRFEFRTPPVVFPSTTIPQPDGEDLVILTARFEFTGFLQAFANGQAVFAHDLTGTGTAGAAFSDALGDQRWLEESQPAYRFDAAEPVPEPATMVLVAIGAATAAARRRCRGRASDSPRGPARDHGSKEPSGGTHSRGVRHERLQEVAG